MTIFDSSQGRVSLDAKDHLVVAAGSGGTLAGLAIAAHLSQQPFKV